MKDNEKNLSDGLSNDELESVAGGKREDWTDAQIKALKDYVSVEELKNMYGQEEIDSTLNYVLEKYSPQGFLNFLLAEGCQNDYNDLEGVLGSK